MDSTNKETNFLERYEISQVINVSGTMTSLGASRVVPEAIRAGAEIQSRTGDEHKNADYYDFHLDHCDSVQELRIPEQPGIGKEQYPDGKAAAKGAGDLTRDYIPIAQGRRQQQGP